MLIHSVFFELIVHDGRLMSNLMIFLKKKKKKKKQKETNNIDNSNVFNFH